MESLPKEMLSHIMAYATSDYRDRMTLLRLRLVSRAIHELVVTDSALSISKVETTFFDQVSHTTRADGNDIRPVLAIGNDGHALSVARYPEPDTPCPGRRILAKFVKSGGWYCVTRTDKLYVHKEGGSQPYMHFELHTKGVDDKGDPVPSLIEWSRMTDDRGTAFDPMTYAGGVSSWSCTTSSGLKVSVDKKHLTIEGADGLEPSATKFGEPYWITSRVTSPMKTLCSYISVAAYYHFDYEFLSKTPDSQDAARESVISELTVLCQSLGDDSYHSRGWYGAPIVYTSPLELEHASGIIHRDRT